MKLQRAVVLAMFVAAWAATSSVALAELGGRGGSDAPLAVPNEAGKQIAFEITLIERSAEQLAGESGKHPTAASLLELEKQGKLSSVQRLKLTALENTEARLVLGESAPVVSGRSRGGEGPGGFGRGVALESITYIDIGTTITVTARVEKDGGVVASLNLSRSSLGPSKSADKAEGQDTVTPSQPRRLTSSLTTTARIPSGETAVLCGQQTLTGSTPGEMWVLVTAKVQ